MVSPLLQVTYKSHNVKDKAGRTTCPILYIYVCPMCGATGHDAHTKKYCKKNPGGEDSPMTAFMRTGRTSTGKRRPITGATSHAYGPGYGQGDVNPNVLRHAAAPLVWVNYSNYSQYSSLLHQTHSMMSQAQSRMVGLPSQNQLSPLQLSQARVVEAMRNVPPPNYSVGGASGYSGGASGYSGGASGGYSGGASGGYSGGASGGYSGGASGGYSGGASNYSAGASNYSSNYSAAGVGPGASSFTSGASNFSAGASGYSTAGHGASSFSAAVGGAGAFSFKPQAPTPTPTFGNAGYGPVPQATTSQSSSSISPSRFSTSSSSSMPGSSPHSPQQQQSAFAPSIPAPLVLGSSQSAVCRPLMARNQAAAPQKPADVEAMMAMTEQMNQIVENLLD
jgi:hypothetical protein